MRDIITYDEFILEQKEKPEENEDMEAEEDLDSADGVDRYYSRWIKRRKDRALGAKEAMRPKGSVNGVYGNSMQYGTVQ